MKKMILVAGIVAVCLMSGTTTKVKADELFLNNESEQGIMNFSMTIQFKFSSISTQKYTVGGKTYTLLSYNGTKGNYIGVYTY